jgi:threonine/homoserine/homoserine lactone efflux protein
MPSLQLLLTFLATAAIFAFIPGPAMLYAAARTLTGGRSSGLMASLGIHLGGYVHIVAAAAGLSIILHAVPMLYGAVKIFGAAYLVWLGISMLRAKAQGDVAITGIEPKSGRRAFIESITVEALNPKAAIFYLAFLPQFIDASADLPIWVQFVLLGTVINMMFSLGDLIAVALAGAVVSRLQRSSRLQRVLERTGGSILIGLGAHLAFQRN